MKLRIFQYLVLAIVLITASNVLVAHCEMPCGIYDDKMRINMIDEDIITIKKSMKQINIAEAISTSNTNEMTKENTVTKNGEISYNQIVRWVITKDKTADNIQNIVSQYFMTQRISPDTKNYNEKLSLLHFMLIYAMKCKQTTNIDNVNALKELLTKFDLIYFKKQ